MSLSRKIFASTDFKAVGKGRARAVVATLNVVDRDGEITVPGAYGTQTAKLLGGHNWMCPSLGVAKIHEEGNEVIADIEFNLDLPVAKDWYTSVKFNFENGVRQEYSCGFRVKKVSYREEDDNRPYRVRVLEDLEVFEVSFVTAGAGINTRTLDIKADAQESSDLDTCIKAAETAARALDSFCAAKGEPDSEELQRLEPALDALVQAHGKAADLVRKRLAPEPDAQELDRQRAETVALDALYQLELDAAEYAARV